jgi:hypothetical protein
MKSNRYTQAKFDTYLEFDKHTKECPQCQEAMRGVFLKATVDEIEEGCCEVGRPLYLEYSGNASGFPHLEEVERRLKAGETVYIWYHNADNDMFNDPLLYYNAIKLVPTSPGKYDRYWWSRQGWHSTGDYDKDCPAKARKLNPLVHGEILASEEEANKKVLEWLEEAAKDMWR